MASMIVNDNALKLNGSSLIVPRAFNIGGKDYDVTIEGSDFPLGMVGHQLVAAKVKTAVQAYFTQIATAFQINELHGVEIVFDKTNQVITSTSGLGGDAENTQLELDQFSKKVLEDDTFSAKYSIAQENTDIRKFTLNDATRYLCGWVLASPRSVLEAWRPVQRRESSTLSSSVSLARQTNSSHRLPYQPAIVPSQPQQTRRSSLVSDIAPLVANASYFSSRHQHNLPLASLDELNEECKSEQSSDSRLQIEAASDSSDGYDSFEDSEILSPASQPLLTEFQIATVTNSSASSPVCKGSGSPVTSEDSAIFIEQTNKAESYVINLMKRFKEDNAAKLAALNSIN
jgi:hypothetical protein